MSSVRAGLIAALPGAVVGLVLLLVLLPTEPAAGVTFSESPWTDEAWTVLGARNMALLGTWATDDLRAYLLQLPFHLAQLGIFELFGVGIIQARVLSVVLSVSTVLLTAMLVTRHFGRTAGVISGIGVATSALFVYYGRLAYLEPMVTFWLTAGMAVLLVAPQRRALTAGVLGGACFALAVGTKPSSLAATAGILLGAAVAARFTRMPTIGPLVASGVILVAGIGWVVLIGLPNREAIELVLRWWPQQPVPPTPLDWVIRVGRYVRASDGANLLTLPLYVAAAVGVLLAWARRQTLARGQLLLIGAAIGWVVLGIGFLVLTAYRPNRYVVPLLPPLAMLGGIGAAWLLVRVAANARRLLAVALVGALVAPGILLWGGWLSTSSSRLPAIQAELLEIMDDGAAVEGGVGSAFAMRVTVPTLLSRPAIGMNGGDLYEEYGVRWLVADETYVPAWAGDHPDAWAARETIRCWPWGDDGNECLIRVP
ncbi:MAG: glycosyltransferase family 39 protein [Chloroflexota bacterium]|nr:glycosyltransferase family 39 protein [Chloroflexota bacterium]